MPTNLSVCCLVCSGTCPSVEKVPMCILHLEFGLLCTFGICFISLTEYILQGNSGSVALLGINTNLFEQKQ